MNIFHVIIFLFVNSLNVNSWGPTGHRVVGEIAEQNISEKTREEISKILDGQTLAYVSTFADEIKSDDRYDIYYPWHYINFDLDKDYMDTPPSDNGDLYIAINKCIDVLKDASSDKESKAFHLKLLVHFVGDLHQPLHLGQEIDRGANRIYVKWFGSNTNLHSVWDSKMIDSYKMSYSEMAYTLQKIYKNKSNHFKREDLVNWIDEIHDLPKNEWWKKEGAGVDFVRTLFPNISISLGLGIGQIAQILPGNTPDKNTTILHYVAPETPKNEEDKAELDHFMNFLRDVVNDEDYALGLEIQRGLDSNSKENVIFGKNERGNQYFHKYVDFFIDENIKKPPIL